MNLPSSREARRCRPLLGTYVEITAAGLEEEKLQNAIAAAFAAVERVQFSMSVHAPGSELSRLNREAFDRSVKVNAKLFEVLSRAGQLAAESNGAFDHTIAPTLARWGLLPASLRRKPGGTWREVVLSPGRWVRFLRPLAVDLGGIAKGFAVDEAIKALRKRGVVSAVVNAGGDLRVFGPQPSIIHLRDPSRPRTFAGIVSLQEAALATSSPCFTERGWRGSRVSHLVDSVRQSAITGPVSVTVRAAECWLADALTKAVLNAPRRARELMAKYNAEAVVLAL